MIFATVGTQLPFPRLIGWLDRVAAESAEPVLAQTGDDSGAYPHLSAQPWLDAGGFDAALARADRMVAHAGIGSLLKALRAGKPIIIVPRLARLGEHRNDHQVATARHFAGVPGVHVAEDYETLAALLARSRLEPPSPGEASPERAALIANLRQTFADWAR